MAKFYIGKRIYPDNAFILPNSAANILADNWLAGCAGMQSASLYRQRIELLRNKGSRKCVLGTGRLCQNRVSLQMIT